MKCLTALLVLGSAIVASAADWPARVFAPYMYIGAGDHFQLTECDDACGQKFYTLAFIIADKRERAGLGRTVPSGTEPLC